MKNKCLSGYDCKYILIDDDKQYCTCLNDCQYKIEENYNANQSKKIKVTDQQRAIHEAMSKFGTTTAKRYNTGKPRYSLIDYASLESLVRVLEFGESKYGRDNWKLSLSKESVLDSMIRHVAKLNDGEECDSESGLSHIGHILANGMFLEYYKRKDKKID